MGMQQKAQKAAETAPITAIERLGLRVSAMIGSPKAQLERRAVIHRLDTDTDEAWDGIMMLLADTYGLALAFDEAGYVTVSWEAVETEEAQEVAEAREGRTQVEEEAPF